MAGAGAAYTLRKRGYDVTVIEQNGRLGGRVKSQLVKGAAIEMGAGFMTASYSNVLQFVKNVGLEEKLFSPTEATRVVRNGKLLLVTPRTIMHNKTLSLGAKLQFMKLACRVLYHWRRLNMQTFWKASSFDQRSVSDMFPSRAGKELLERVLQPSLNGYFYWTPEQTSEAVLLIVFKALLMGGKFKLAGGLQQIPEAATKGCTVLLNTTVGRVVQARGGTFELTVKSDQKQQTLSADGVVCATTANVVPQIIAELSRAQNDFFSSVKYSSAALVAKMYDNDKLQGNVAIGFPRQEKVELSSVTVSPEPTGKIFLLGNVKIYASGTNARKLGSLSDKDLEKRLESIAKPFMGDAIKGSPAPHARYLQRWPNAIPIFEPGHIKRIELFANGQIEDQSRALVFAGDYIGGPFMEGAFTSGIQAAERLDKRLLHLSVSGS